MIAHVCRAALILAAGAACLVVALAAGKEAGQPAPPEARLFVIEREIMANDPGGEFHPRRCVRREELAGVIHRTVEAMARDERLRGPAGPPGPQGPRGEAAGDADIAGAIQRFSLEVGNDLTDIKDDIADLQDTTDQLGGRVDALDKTSLNAEAKHDKLEQRVAQLEAAVRDLRGEIARLGAAPAPPDRPRTP